VAVNTGLPSNTNVLSLASIGTNMFAGTSGSVYISTDNGTSWAAANKGLSFNAVNSLAVNGTNIFAGTYGDLYLSSNFGASWTAVNTGLTNKYVNTLTVSGTNIFAGTDGGIFLSSNNGTNWTAVNTGLTNPHVYSFAINSNKIFAGGNQVYSMDIVTSIEKIERQENTIKVVPNPSSGTFFIDSDNKDDLQTEVVITNIHGQELYRGKYNFSEQRTINMENPVKGLYFLHLQNSNGVNSRKRSLIFACCFFVE
jgi:hypothetical protein